MDFEHYNKMNNTLEPQGTYSQVSINHSYVNNVLFQLQNCEPQPSISDQNMVDIPQPRHIRREINHHVLSKNCGVCGWDRIWNQSGILQSFHTFHKSPEITYHIKNLTALIADLANIEDTDKKSRRHNNHIRNAFLSLWCITLPSKRSQQTQTDFMGKERTSASSFAWRSYSLAVHSRSLLPIM